MIPKNGAVEVPPHASVAVVESSLDQLLPVEFRADLVLELRDENDALVLAIVIEVQRDVDPDKKFSWPAYVAVVRARKRCGTATGRAGSPWSRRRSPASAGSTRRTRWSIFSSSGTGCGSP
ncbi:hypothetical protein [Sorangium sp. So ce887]|uniref:hypothetical protein n=1 Tax=Sorangium sp. So ce887 TaxID=3133324 RepID=UPI003F635A15